MTINSQPRVNAASSDDKDLGWGEPKGIVYQKAYVEFFCSPEKLLLLKKEIQNFPSLTYHAVNQKGDTFKNSQHRVNAVTWGVFPDSELKQPTVVDTESFLVWKSEAFALWKNWSSIYEETSKSKEIIDNIQDTHYLVNIVDNDFISGDIFKIFTKIINDQNN